MDEMKFDMGGAASVLGTFRAVAELKPALNVVGLVPSCENMPERRRDQAGRHRHQPVGPDHRDPQHRRRGPPDPVRRADLCRALQAGAVIDIATLTGACVVALGDVRSGLFATDDALAEQLLAAGEAALDPCWRMPLDDEYAEA